jgi:3,4-dihydroxy 2-butanone 4-phosphate synthase / GTP cyclohydrolase II
MSDFKAALEDFKNGKFLIVTDDADRENEGDLILLAQTAKTEQLGFHGAPYIGRYLRCYY